MELYFLRHGVAGQHGSYKDDSQRPLTSEGIRKMTEIARGMKDLGLTFDRVLSSPYARASQTALIVAKIFKISRPKLVLTDHLLPRPSFRELVKEINAHKQKSILLVGHEPHLTQFMSFLLSDGPQLSIQLKKGGLSLLSMDKLTGSGCASLEWLLAPSQLRALAS